MKNEPLCSIVIVSYNGKKLLSKSVFLGKKTNNQAEYLALALGVFFLKPEINKLQPSIIKITSDSELLIKQMRGEYKVKNPTLKILKEITLSILNKTKCKYGHVLRNKNKKADELANIAVDKKIIMPKDFAKILQENNL